jgi:RNA polymerase sigma factor (sigma-70 family)
MSLESLKKINRAKHELAQTLGREPNDEEVAKALPEFTESDIAYYETLPLDTVSLDAPVGEDATESVEDFIKVDETSDEVTEGLEDEDQARLISQALTYLDEREREIISLLYGLDDGEAKSLEEVGKRYNLSRERIRQIRDAALKKMRKELK